MTSPRLVPRMMFHFPLSCSAALVLPAVAVRQSEKNTGTSSAPPEDDPTPTLEAVAAEDDGAAAEDETCGWDVPPDVAALLPPAEEDAPPDPAELAPADDDPPPLVGALELWPGNALLAMAVDVDDTGPGELELWLPWDAPPADDDDPVPPVHTQSPSAVPSALHSCAPGRPSVQVHMRLALGMHACWVPLVPGHPQTPVPTTNTSPTTQGNAERCMGTSAGQGDGT